MTKQTSKTSNNGKDCEELKGDVLGKNWNWGDASSRVNNEPTDLAGQSLACWKKKESLCGWS